VRGEPAYLAISHLTASREVPQFSVTGTGMTFPSLSTVTLTVWPGVAVQTVGYQLAEQEHRRITVRMLSAEHRRRERTGNRDPLGTPGNSHALPH
jgi:hypothetical protein